MITDIAFNYEKGDIDLLNTVVFRARNLLLTQLGELHFNTAWGIDLAYFFNPDVQIENVVFLNYLQQQITSKGMNITDLKAIVEQFYQNIILTVSDN